MKKQLTTLAAFLLFGMPCTFAQYWNTTGNSGTTPPSNFIGTTDSKALVFKTNSALSGRIDPVSLNTALGYLVLSAITSGGDNTAIGESALFSNTTAGTNTAVGEYSQYSTTTGSLNTSIGGESLDNNTTGSCNTGIGTFALTGCISGTYNTALGYDANFNTSSTAYTNTTALGYQSRVTASNQIRVGNTSVTSIGGVVGWSTVSDGRFKSNINTNVPGLTFIRQLRPVTYTLNTTALASYLQPESFTTKNKTGIPTLQNESTSSESIVYSGFIAQEVEALAQKIGYNFNGVDKPKNDKDLYGLRYEEFVPTLVKAVQELGNNNDSLQQQIADLKLQNQQLQSQMNDVLQQLQILKKGGAFSTVTNNLPMLRQNAPNPVTSATIISYYLPATTTSAKLMVYNVNGQLIKTIGLTAIGEGLATIQAGELAAGSYFYSLVIDGQKIDTKKMIIAP